MAHPGLLLICFSWKNIKLLIVQKLRVNLSVHNVYKNTDCHEWMTFDEFDQTVVSKDSAFPFIRWSCLYGKGPSIFFLSIVRKIYTDNFASYVCDNQTINDFLWHQHCCTKSKERKIKHTLPSISIQCSTWNSLGFSVTRKLHSDLHFLFLPFSSL